MLTDLPQDILTHCLGPLLCIESKLNLNEILPRDRRIILKLSREFCEDHHLGVLTRNFRARIEKYDDQFSRWESKRFTTLYKMVQDFSKPFHFALYKNIRFKETVIQKLVEFQDTQIPLYINDTQPVTQKWYAMLQRQCRKTITKILHHT
jgi:hypothetical protein